MQKILLVEDDMEIRESLVVFLSGEGFSVSCASGAKEARTQITTQTFDLALLDIALADGNGFQICSAAKDIGLPVIFLTASGDENSVVNGLEMGADDYIAKPFRPRELVSRIRNVLRRYAGTESKIVVGRIMVDTERNAVYLLRSPEDAAGSGMNIEKQELSLTALEYRLLMTFVNNRGRLLSREKLLEDIWDIAGDFVNDNTLTVYIKRLREKIELDPQKPEIIKTVRGLGYRMD